MGTELKYEDKQTNIFKFNNECTIQYYSHTL